MAYSGSYGGSSHSCRSYCNISGYYNAGFQCPGLFCCGSLNVRFCCNNSSLDISNSYPEKCRCAMSSCSYLSWDVLLPCVAAALFVLLMVTICCCQGCRGCVKCRQVFRRECLRTNSTTVSNGPEGSPANLEEGQHTASDSTFPHLPPYEFGPPKYESIELAEAPPKYEDIMTPGGHSETHVNSAFVGDSNTHDYSAATPVYSVTPDRTVTDESPSRDALVPGTSDGRVSGGDGPVAKNSEVPAAVQNTDGASQQRVGLQSNQDSSLTLSPPSHELAPNADSESISTCPDQVVICQEVSTCNMQVGGGMDRSVDTEALQVVAVRTTSEERNRGHEV